MRLKMSLLLLIVSLSFSSFCQINYQAVVRDTNNNPTLNEDVIIEVELFQNGNSIYSELHSTNTGALGIVNLAIGEGEFPSSNFNEIDWFIKGYGDQKRIN